MNRAGSSQIRRLLLTAVGNLCSIPASSGSRKSWASAHFGTSRGGKDRAAGAAVAGCGAVITWGVGTGCGTRVPGTDVGTLLRGDAGTRALVAGVGEGTAIGVVSACEAADLTAEAGVVGVQRAVWVTSVICAEKLLSLCFEENRNE